MRHAKFLYTASLFLALGCSDDDGSTKNIVGSGGIGGGAPGGAAGAGFGGSATGGFAAGAAGGSGGASGGAGGASAAGGQPAELCESQPIEFVASWVPPQPIGQGVCSESEIDAMVSACFGPPGDIFGNTAACEQARADNPACAACMISDEGAAEHGAIVDYRATRGFFDRNVHGCLAHAEGDLSDAGCGAKALAAFACANESCAGCHPVASPFDLQDLNRCSADAGDGPCEAEFDAFNACIQTLSGPINDVCADNSMTVPVATAYGKLFCGDGVASAD